MYFKPIHFKVKPGLLTQTCLYGALLCAQPLFAEKAPQQYFDPVSGKLISASAFESRISEDEELIFTVKVDRVELGELTTIRKDKTFLVDPKQVIEVLDFPIQLDINQETSKDSNQFIKVKASGWFIKPTNKFGIKTALEDEIAVYTIESKANQYKLRANDIITKNNEYLIPLSTVLSWFDIEHKVDKAGLIIRLISKEKLPIQAKMERRNKQGYTESKNTTPQYPSRNVPYQLMAPIFTDVQVSAYKGYADRNKYNLSLLGSGDLAYMTGRYYFRHSHDLSTDKTQTSFRLSLERNDIDSQLLGPLNASHISVGDISSSPLANVPSSGSGIGVRINNRPYGRITNSLTQDFTGYQQPDWEVELYRNNIFIDSQIVQEDGQYQFLNQNLTIGKNTFTLKFYGPQGQIEEKTEIFDVTPEALSGKSIIYDLSIIQQSTQLSNLFSSSDDSSKYYGLNLKLEKELSANASFTTGFSQFHKSNGVRHQYLQPGLRVFFGRTLINLHYLKDLSQGDQTGLNLSTSLGNHTFSFGSVVHSEDFDLDTPPSKIKNSAGIQGPVIKTKPFTLDYQLLATVEESFTKTQTETYKINLAAKISRLRITNNNSYTRYSPYNLASTETQDGKLQFSSQIGSTNVRSGFSYNLKPISEVESGNIELQWNLLPNVSSQLGYVYNFITDADSKSLALNWKTPYFITSFKVTQTPTDTTGSINMRFGLAHDGLKDSIHMTSRKIANTGAVAALVYEDLNNNQLFDENEPVIENAKIKAVQQRKRATTDESGKVFLTGLQGSQPTDIELDRSSLEDPFWIQSTKGVSFLPRPGLTKYIMIPVVTSGEIEGVVSFSDSLFLPSLEQGRVPLLLTNIKTGEKLETISSYDGFYLLEAVPPGDYTLQIKPSFLKKSKLESRSPIDVHIGFSGTLILGANFELHPPGKYKYTTESFETDNAFNIDLGNFISEENAKITLGALRNVFSSILSTSKDEATYEMLLVKKSNKKYQLLLGPLFNLNHAKYICGSLVKESLHCKPVKSSLSVTRTVVKRVLKEKLPEAQELKSGNNINKAKEATIKKTVVKKTPPNQNFTLQLMSTLSASGLEGYIEENGLMDTQIITLTDKNGEAKHLLTMGSYADRDDAEQMAVQLKAHLGIKPWIRTFESIYAK